MRVQFLISESKCRTISDEKVLVGFCYTCSKCHECGEEVALVQKLRDVISHLNLVINEIVPKVYHCHK